jgi:hypothetical protein
MTQSSANAVGGEFERKFQPVRTAVSRKAAVAFKYAGEVLPQAANSVIDIVGSSMMTILKTTIQSSAVLILKIIGHSVVNSPTNITEVNPNITVMKLTNLYPNIMVNNQTKDELYAQIDNFEEPQLESSELIYENRDLLFRTPPDDFNRYNTPKHTRWYFKKFQYAVDRMATLLDMTKSEILTEKDQKLKDRALKKVTTDSDKYLYGEIADYIRKFRELDPDKTARYKALQRANEAKRIVDDASRNRL